MNNCSCNSCERAFGLAQMIARLGKEINHEDSIYYWAWKNGIPVYSPALTDGSIGDMLFFHSYKAPGLVLDLVADIRAMNDEAIKAAPRKTGMIILGGGEFQRRPNYRLSRGDGLFWLRWRFCSQAWPSITSATPTSFAMAQITRCLSTLPSRLIAVTAVQTLMRQCRGERSGSTQPQ